MQRFVALYRVSTKEQGLSGLGIEAQRVSVARHVAASGGVLLHEVTEVQSGSGAKSRPQLAEALRLARLCGAALIVSRLDRLGRNVRTIATVLDSGVEVVAAETPGVSRAMLEMLAVFAAEEARLISARTKAALAAAKARGVKLGGKRDGVKPIPAAGIAARRAKADSYARSMVPTMRGLRHLGNSAAAAWLNDAGFVRPGGAALWDHTGVRLLRQRIAALAATETAALAAA